MEQSQDTKILNSISQKPKRGRPKKVILQSDVIQKKPNGRPRLNITDEERHNRQKEMITTWKQKNPEQNNKTTGESSKRAVASMRILKDLFKKKLVPESHFKIVNDLLINKIISK